MSNRDSGLFAFLLGAVVGAAAALLYAPKTGKETRAHLKKFTEDFVEDAGEVGTDLREKGKKRQEICCRKQNKSFRVCGKRKSKIFKSF